MAENNRLFAKYTYAIRKKLELGDATEHSHRPALGILIESLASGVTATNEPKHIECGAPDFRVRKDSVTIGYIEAKDIGKNLNDIESGKGPEGERFLRYLNSLSNLILTDYLEFRWYLDGNRRLTARLGTPTKEGKIRQDNKGADAVYELLSTFLVYEAKAVDTPRNLALHMARLAHMIKNLIMSAFEAEGEGEGLHNQLAAFRDNLIPDLTVEQFADMYAQTIAYGLFAARCRNPTLKDFTRQNAAYLLPKTNPFLRKLFSYIAGPNLDDRIAWLVDDLAQVLAQADMASIRKDFGKQTAEEDPVVHFYETFLTAYDPEVREMRGVYYTPKPVVSYIVRSIDYLLKAHFGKTQGLADSNIYILDPAVGTATFLDIVVNKIYEAIIAQGQQGGWNNYVTESLLNRLFGFELLMAPYAVAHLKLSILLEDTGYHFEGDQRLGIYLTNTLEEAFKKEEHLSGFNEYIVDEANAAAEIKKEKPIMVVLGNPPYSGSSANASVREFVDPKTGRRGRKLTWIGELIDGVFDKDGKEIISGYKRVAGELLGEKNPKWLQDDYVKFIRFGQWRIEHTGQGILGFITNHAYLDNPTFRGMRQALVNSFTDIYILNLHGNRRRREEAPGGGKDENVFEIQLGVAIGLFVKEPENNAPARVHYADIWGLRKAKNDSLAVMSINTTDFMELKPTDPLYLFVPQGDTIQAEYELGWKLTDIFPGNSVGIVTSRDGFVVDFNQKNLEERIANFHGTMLTDDEIRNLFKLEDKERWNVADARKAIRQDKYWKKGFIRCLYRPFDTRSIFYHKAVIERTRSEVMHHMLAGENMGLCIGRAGQVTGPQTWDVVFCSKLIEDFNLFYRGGNVNFPLYLYPREGEMQFKQGRRPNLNSGFIRAFSDKVGLKFIEDGKGDPTETFGPEDIFNYAYAIFYSPSYRNRYAAFLKMDFPRLPLTSDKKLLKALAKLGADLVSLHFMESVVLDNFTTEYPIAGSNVVEKVAYYENTKRVYINKDQYFEGVEPKVWNFHIGGYECCQKWLKDRKGMTLTHNELTDYQKALTALKETIRIMEEIDQLVPKWPLD